MEDIKCEKFRVVEWQSSSARIARWSARLIPNPGREWLREFKAELATEAAIGSFIGGNTQVEGSFLVFDSPENSAGAAAEVLHRAVGRTNAKMTKVEAERGKLRAAEKRQREEAAGELKRMKEQYKDGL